ncbi:MAG: OmpA family protein, partial [Nonlabens sp.]|nr:OmpA family protein [Nonlabens sp.]
ASYRNGQWLEAVALPFASIDFSTQHPTLSSDERTLYFASDMPGGFGKLDIYKVAINTDGTYGTPVNLGATVNTEQVDAFPFMSKDNTLYYATNGKQGFGGLDIFMAEMQNGSFEASTNLGDDINTAKDDHSYIINERDNIVYFSSDRSGMDKLYTATRTENELAKFLVDGYVKDKITGDFLPNAVVTLMDENGNMLQTATVSQNGRYEFRVATGKNYFIKGALKGYATTEELFDTKDSTSKSKTILLSLEPYDVVQARIKENEKGELLINLDKIYFDYNRSAIRSDAAVILDDLVRIMNLYPAMNIEVSAHTDSRGPSAYNLTLSKDRAAAVVAYVTARGIKVNRLQSIGYGEEKLLNDCKDGKKCTEEQHENNRRCEFKIID